MFILRVVFEDELFSNFNIKNNLVYCKKLLFGFNINFDLI